MTLRCWSCLLCLVLVYCQYSEDLVRSKMSKVLFLVKYNFVVTTEQVIFHNKLWGRLLQNQVIFGSFNDTQVNEINKLLPRHSQAISSTAMDKDGALAYKVAYYAMSLFPHYEGYLYAHDDMAINASALATLDQSAFWIASPFETENFVTSWDKRNHQWEWYNGPYGLDAMQSLLTEFDYIANGIQRCSGSQHIWFKGQSDFFYVPQSLRQIFINTMSKFGHANVFLEVAVPTFAHCFLPLNDLLLIELCTYWDDRRGHIDKMRAQCSHTALCYHPVKLSGGKPYLQFMLDKMSVVPSSPDSFLATITATP